MAVKRDYGSFAKAAATRLASQVAALGYAPCADGGFARPHGGWEAAFALQQTQYGDGSFCVNAGVTVPSLDRRWLSVPGAPMAFVLSSRLSARGLDAGDAWLPATDRSELEHSLGLVAEWLAMAEPWFAQFGSLVDIAETYRGRTSLVDIGRNPWDQQLMAATYGFLLAEAGAAAAARAWLQEAERLLSLPVYYAPNHPGMLHEKVKGARPQKADAATLRQLAAVRVSLQALPA